MSATTSIVGHPARATERGTVVGSVRFTAGDGSSTSIVTTGSNGRLATGVVRDAAGEYTLTLRGSWARVAAVANLKGDSIDYAKVVSVTEGSNECTVKINTVVDDSGLDIDDPDGVEVEVMLMLSPSSRGDLS